MRKFCKELSLAYLNPELAKEWDYEKNYPLTPENIFAGSHKRVWLKCEKDHSYDTVLRERNQKGAGCPCCSGHRARKDNCLATLNPELAKEWDYEKNYPLTPEDVTCGSGKKVWWKCKKCGHKWCVGVGVRNRGTRCPCCYGHEVCDRKCLATLNPELAKEWDYEKNYPLTPENITANSSKKVWLIDARGHSYFAKVLNKNNSKNSRGCPKCSRDRVRKDNCLAIINPKLAKEWHPTKNGKLTPYDVMPYGSKKAWWIDDNGHEYYAVIAARSYGSGCPVCKYNKIELKDGAICDSLPEAYYYLKLKSKKIKFHHHIDIGLGKCVCDFYIPNTNRYIEVTSYTNKRWRYWKIYKKGIIRKKNRITKTLHAKFKFVQLKLTAKQRQYVRENSIKRKHHVI